MRQIQQMLISWPAGYSFWAADEWNLHDRFDGLGSLLVTSSKLAMFWMTVSLAGNEAVERITDSLKFRFFLWDDDLSPTPVDGPFTKNVSKSASTSWTSTVVFVVSSRFGTCFVMFNRSLVSYFTKYWNMVDRVIIEHTAKIFNKNDVKLLGLALMC